MHWTNFGPMNWWVMILMMIFGLLIFLVFMALLVVGIVFLVRYLSQGGTAMLSPKSTEDPLGIAKMRYAKGEITKEEFDQLKKDLSQG